MEELQSTRNRFARGVGVAATILIVGLVVLVFGIQISNAFQTRAEERHLEQAVATEEAHYEELLEELEYKKSDEYVEYWARTEARMAKPGEVVVVPTAEVPTDSEAGPASDQDGEPFWMAVWSYLFADPNP